MAGVKLWEYYIRLPQDIVDDPAINLSLNAFRLLVYLCRHQLRVGKMQIRLTQDEILHGRKVAGLRIDQGSKIRVQRDIIKAREELIALGWLKYYPLEGVWIYELVIQDQPVRYQNDTNDQYQKDTERYQKDTKSVSKRHRNRYQNDTDKNNKVLHKTQDTHKKAGESAGTPTAEAVGYHAHLRGLSSASATQPELYRRSQASLVPVRGEGFTELEVAFAICIELSLVGQEHRVFLAEVVKTYRRTYSERTCEEAGEDLLRLWAEYQKAATGEFAVGWKKFFSEGLYLKRDKWKKVKAHQQPAAAKDASDLIKERKAQIGARE